MKKIQYNKKTVKIHHLGYTIVFLDIKDYNHQINIDRFENVCICIGSHKSEIYLKDIQKYSDQKFFMHNASSLAHEILHALQHLSEYRGIDMSQEKEHIAYLLQYIMNEFIGLEYSI